MSADFRFPSGAQRRAMRDAPRLHLPPPAGNPAHQQLAMPAADTPASSSDPSGPRSEPIGHDWVLELPSLDQFNQLPPAAFDRPVCDPPEIEAAVGEAPPPAPVSNRVPKTPAAEQSFERPTPSVHEGGQSASSSAAVGGLLFNQVPVAAMEAVMIERARHFAFGHTIADDVAAVSQNIRSLTRRAEKLIVCAAEDLQFRRGDYRANAKRHLARAAAMLLAQWDAIDATPPDPEFTDEPF